MYDVPIVVPTSMKNTCKHTMYYVVRNANKPCYY